MIKGWTVLFVVLFGYIFHQLRKTRPYINCISSFYSREGSLPLILKTPKFMLFEHITARYNESRRRHPRSMAYSMK